MILKNTSLSAILALGLILLSCQDHLNPLVTLKATLNGNSVKPLPITTSATGLFTGNLDLTTKVLSYTLSYSGLSAPATAAHLHKASALTGTGPVDIAFIGVPNAIAGTFAGSAFMLSQHQIDSLLAGFYYVDLHTTIYPGGEIRGQVLKQ